MIDIHHHCLPAVDDGPRTMEEAVELCAMAAEEGIETIVATPHVLRGRWRRFAPAELQQRLEELRARTDDRPHLVLGSEYFFAHDMADVLAAGSSIVPLGGGRAVLVEFAAQTMPPLVEQPLYRAQLDGWTIVIAHPERNLALQAKPELLLSLMRLGVKTQVTAGSITGSFGPAAQRAALDWLRRGWVHVVATDAHSVGKRPPHARAARRQVEELCGQQIAQALFVDNPRAIVAGTALAWEPDLPYSTVSPGLLTRLKRLFEK
jgi:protein-tyrosine phosphatase